MKQMHKGCSILDFHPYGKKQHDSVIDMVLAHNDRWRSLNIRHNIVSRFLNSSDLQIATKIALILSLVQRRARADDRCEHHFPKRLCGAIVLWYDILG